MVRILSLATATPGFKLNQKEALRFILQNFKLKKSSRVLYEKVLSDPSIRSRRFALKSLMEVLEENPDRINQRFERQAVALSAQALTKALKTIHLPPKSVDFLAVSTCTGYLCPGLSTRLIDAVDLKRDIHCLDIVGMGCGSAIPALEAAHNFIKANPKAVAAVVSTEICSAAMFSDDSADLVISNAIFADGSASAVLSNSANRGFAQLKNFSAVTHPEWREHIRFKMQSGRLRNVLHADVPKHVGKSLKPIVEKVLALSGKSMDGIRHWVFHSGGKKVLDAVQESLDLPQNKMMLSRRILRRFGNLSSPAVLFGLADLIQNRPRPKKGDLGLLVSFGAGFSAYACLLEFN